MKTKFNLVRTCNACPEQYNVYLNETGDLVGYFRLRWGHFTVEYPDSGGELVYSANTRGDGAFEAEERKEHLTAACKAIESRLDPVSVELFEIVNKE